MQARNGNIFVGIIFEQVPTYKGLFVVVRKPPLSSNYFLGLGVFSFVGQATKGSIQCSILILKLVHYDDDLHQFCIATIITLFGCILLKNFRGQFLFDMVSAGTYSFPK